MSRIDRFLYCGSLEDLFPDRSQVALPKTSSNHTSISLEWKKILGGHSPFKFEEIWFLEPDFMEVVKHVWNNVDVSGSASQIFATKLKTLKKTLIAWIKSSGDSLKSSMEACRVRIKEVDKLEEVRVTFRVMRET